MKSFNNCSICSWAESPLKEIDEDGLELKDFPNDAFRAILNIDPKQKELIRRYLECSGEVQSVVRSMFAVLDHPLTTNEDRQRAITTIADALSVNPMEGHGKYGFDFLTAERDAARKQEQVECLWRAV